MHRLIRNSTILVLTLALVAPALFSQPQGREGRDQVHVATERALNPAAKRGNERVPQFQSLRMPRVSGLSVSAEEAGVNGPGFDVDVDITMTTTRTYNPTWSYFNIYYFQGVPDTARMGVNNTTFSYLGAPTSLTGTTRTLFYGFSYNTNPPPDTYFSAVQFANIASGNLVQANPFTFAGYRTYINVPLPIPAVDFGDGATMGTLSLTQPSSTQTGTTTGGLTSVRRRWRASLSHTYADRTPKTVTVASGCCSPGVQTSTSPGGGGAGRGGGNAVSTYATLNYQRIGLGRVFSGSGDVSLVSGYFNYVSFGNYTGTTVTNATNISSGPFRRTTYTFYNGPTTYPSTALDQVTASVMASPGTLAIPTAGTYGLAALALLLAGFGVIILRR